MGNNAVVARRQQNSARGGPATAGGPLNHRHSHERYPVGVLEVGIVRSLYLFEDNDEWRCRRFTWYSVKSRLYHTRQDAA